MIEIYTDGATEPNPGPGGWAAVIFYADGQTKTLCGGSIDTTNNRMEMTAAIEALEAVESGKVCVYSDSKYLINGITRWIRNWKRNGWVTSDGDDVKNKDLWQALYAAQKGKAVTWKWVRGHSGNVVHDYVDELSYYMIGRDKTLITDEQLDELDYLLRENTGKDLGSYLADLDPKKLTAEYFYAVKQYLLGKKDYKWLMSRLNP